MQAHQFFYFKNCGKKMIEETSLADLQALRSLTPMYNYNQIVIEDEKEVLVYFLRRLNFEMDHRYDSYELSNEEISTLKQNIDRIYQAYSQKRITLRNVEGVWGLLTFLFRNINGMLLYLQFEQLLEPYPETQEKNDDHNIKQEYPDFDPKKYFQHNNLWKDSTKFMKRLRKLERSIKDESYKVAKEDCLKIFRIMFSEQIDYQQAQHHFSKRYQEFKTQVLKKSKDSKMRKGAIRENYFATRIVDDGFIASEPDNFRSINEVFTKDEYLNLYQQGNNTMKGPFHKCKSVIDEVPESEEESQSVVNRAIEVEEDSVLVSTISYPNKRERTTVYTKSPVSSKKKRFQFGEDKPARIKPNLKRLSRRNFIERLFTMTEDKTLLLKELKKDREKQKQKKKKTEKIQKIKRKIAYASDEEDEEMRTNTRKKRTPKARRMEIESDSQSIMSHRSLGRQEQYSISEMEEESIFEEQTKKGRIARKHTPIKNNKVRPQYARIYDEDLISDDEEPEQFIAVKPIRQVQLVLINKKEDKSLAYLKRNQKDSKARNQNGRIQKMDNIQLRKIELHQQASLFLTIDMQAYIYYLCELEGQKQIKKEVMTVSKELLDRSQKQADIDLTLKIIALNAMQMIAGKDKVIWDRYRDTYLFPMLKYQIITNTFRAITDIFNSFFESSNEVNLTFLHKYKQFLQIIYARCQDRAPLRQKITAIIYDCLVTPRRLNDWKKRSFDLGSAFIVLETPYMTGPRHSKYKLMGQAQNSITLILASFIFDTLFLKDLQDADRQTISLSKKQYLQTLTKQLEEKSMKDKLRQCIFKFTSIFHQYHLLYRPEITDDYFFKVLRIIYISVHIMKDYLVNIENYALIRQHVEFIRLMFKQFIDKKLAQNPNIKNLFLMNMISIQSKFNENFQEPRMEGKSNILVIVYASILNFLLSYDCFKQKYFQDRFLKYLSENLKKEMDIIVNKMDLYTLSSIFNLASTLYKMKIGSQVVDDNNQFNMEKTGNPLKFVENNPKYSDIRCLIVSYFNKIDQRYDELSLNLNSMMKEKDKIAQNRQNTTQAQQIDKKINTIKQIIVHCSQIMASFLNTFILNSEAQYAISQQPESISHFFFSLSFAIEHNYFIKYLANKTMSGCNNSALANKCAQILQHLFVKVPDFVPYLFKKKPDSNTNHSEDSDIDFQEIQATKKQKERHDKIFKLYYQIITQNTTKMFQNSTKAKREQEISYFSGLEHKDYFQPLASVYASQLVSKFQTRGYIIQNTMMKFITDGFILHHSSTSRIEKVIYYLKYLFKYLNNYISAVKHRGNVQQTALKAGIIENVVIKWHKQIVFAVLLGQGLKSNPNFFNLPVEDLITQLKRSRLLEAKSLLPFKKQAGYTHFLVCLQKCNNLSSNSSLLSEFCNSFSTLGEQSQERKSLNLSLYDLLNDFQSILRKMQLSSREKWYEALESIRIIIFLLDWKTIKVECIKSYLNDMQVISRAESLISRIKITESNLVLLLTFFMKIKSSSMNPYQIKDTMTIYIDIICKNLQVKEQQEDYQLKEQFKIFAILRQSLKKNREIEEIGKQFLCALSRKFWMNLFNQQSQQRNFNIRIKLQKFLQLMKDSYWERSVYQQLLNQNRPIFQNLIRNHFSIPPLKLAGSDRPISNFEDMVYVCMIGQHSDFFVIKALIRYLLNRNSRMPSKVGIMKQIIDKFIIFNMEGNTALNDWARQEMEKLQLFYRNNKVIMQMMQIE